MDFLQKNLFVKLRAEHFGTQEEMDPMTTFKQKKIAQMMQNLGAVPRGEVRMNCGFLNRRLEAIQENERHAIDTSVETLRLLRIIVSNINGILAYGVNLAGIIELGLYLRTKGDKVDFVKLDRWLAKLRIVHMAQLQGSVLVLFFDFETDEIPFMRRVERGAYKLTLRSLYYNTKDQQEIEFRETEAGFVHATGGTMAKNLRRSMRYLEYAPIETICNFCNNFFKSLSEIEE